MTRIIIISFLLILLPLVSYSEELTNYEKGELLGSLGFAAMTIDAYYEICYSNGVRNDNNLNGIDKLAKDKWGFAFSEMMIKNDERTGRDSRQEAHKLIHYVIKQTGGCNSPGMEKWFKKMQLIHEQNLDKFHSAR